MSDFWAFRKMVTPVIIQIVFFRINETLTKIKHALECKAIHLD